MSDETDLKARAAALGIDVDGRWSEARIKQEIEKATPKVAALHPFRVVRDYWTEDGERVRAGVIVELPAEDALDGIESGALARVR